MCYSRTSAPAAAATLGDSGGGFAYFDGAVRDGLASLASAESSGTGFLLPKKPNIGGVGGRVGAWVE